MTARLTWTCDVPGCGEVSEVDVSESYALGLNVPIAPPDGWATDVDGQAYCPAEACQRAHARSYGDEPEREPDTRDTL